MDIRETLRTSEFWALIAAVVLHTLAFNGWGVDPVEAKMWEVALLTYAAGRFTGKTAKASIPGAK
jgi:hypothetical protein